MNEIIVLTTADSDELAAAVSKALVERRAAACVNIIPGIRSLYRWQGKVCDEPERLLLIKSSRDHFEKVCAIIREIHTYDVPEAIAIDIADGDPRYLAWIGDQLG